MLRACITDLVVERSKSGPSRRRSAKRYFLPDPLTSESIVEVAEIVVYRIAKDFAST